MLGLGSEDLKPWDKGSQSMQGSESQSISGSVGSCLGSMYRICLDQNVSIFGTVLRVVKKVEISQPLPWEPRYDTNTEFSSNVQQESFYPCFCLLTV